MGRIVFIDLLCSFDTIQSFWIFPCIAHLQVTVQSPKASIQDWCTVLLLLVQGSFVWRQAESYSTWPCCREGELLWEKGERGWEGHTDNLGSPWWAQQGGSWQPPVTSSGERGSGEGTHDGCWWWSSVKGWANPGLEGEIYRIDTCHNGKHRVRVAQNASPAFTCLATMSTASSLLNATYVWFLLLSN